MENRGFDFTARKTAVPGVKACEPVVLGPTPREMAAAPRPHSMMAWMYAHRAWHVALNMPTLTGSPALASVQHPQTHALENRLRFTPEMNPAHEIMNPAPRAPISVRRLLPNGR